MSLYHAETYEAQEGASEILERLLRLQPEIITITGGDCSGRDAVAERVIHAAERAHREVIIIKDLMAECELLMERKGTGWHDLIIHDRMGYLGLLRDIIEDQDAAVEMALAELGGTNGLIVLQGDARVENYTCTVGQDWDEHIRPAFSGEEFIDHKAMGQADRVLFLPTLAKLDSRVYQQRIEADEAGYASADEALRANERRLKMWATHPDLHILEQSDPKKATEQALNIMNCRDHETIQHWRVDPAIVDEWLEVLAVQDRMSHKKPKKRNLKSRKITETYHEHNGINFCMRKEVCEDAGGKVYTSHRLDIEADGTYGEIEKTPRKINGKEYATLLAQVACWGRVERIREAINAPTGLVYCDRYLHPTFGLAFCILTTEHCNMREREMSLPPFPGAVREDIFDPRQIAQLAS
jgi:hypothetical protein